MLQRFISTRLSTKRRSRLALPALLLSGLLATGGLYAVFAPAQATEKAADQTQIEKGRALFQLGCSSCHGLNAEGIATKNGGQYGPSLVGVGAAAVDFQVGTGRMPMAQPGTQALRKRPVYTQDEIDALAAFVASLAPGPQIPTDEQVDPAKGDVQRGGEFFRTNCTACHNFAGSGGALPHGRFAPSLIGTSPRHIFEAMETGPQQMPVFSEGNITSKEKRDIIAYLKKNEQTPGYGGFSLGSLGPVSEGMFVWLVGIASLVGAGIWITSHGSRVKRNLKGDA
ncbi:MAG TPA: cytochrome c [Nocardioidaceae bacterium]|jgi:ubiquinol-cytochrome c reductase cytochrome c subunit|nr:cytochrome c [Nocardioidaceae bacterium]